MKKSLAKMTCMMCGAQATNRHHVIPQALKPKKNFTIPLCWEHKDACHPVIKVYKVDRHLKRKTGSSDKLIHSLENHIQSLSKEPYMEKRLSKTRFLVNGLRQNIISIREDLKVKIKNTEFHFHQSIE